MFLEDLVVDTLPHRAGLVEHHIADILNVAGKLHLLFAKVVDAEIFSNPKRPIDEIVPIFALVERGGNFDPQLLKKIVRIAEIVGHHPVEVGVKDIAVFVKQQLQRMLVAAEVILN